MTHYTKRRRHIASIVLSPSQHSGNLIGFERQIRDFVKNLLLTIISYVKNLISCFKNFLKKMI